MNSRELLLANVRGEKTARVPIWIMRQAGRYMPEYRRLREKHSFEQLCRTPDLAAEVTAQPIDSFGFDAAIIFSDILYILEPLGINLKYDPGPIIEPLLERPEQADRFTAYDPEKELAFVGEALVKTRERIGDKIALLGFCGAPFTLLCYLCGSSGANGFARAVAFLIKHPEAGRRLLSLLADLSCAYLKMQFKAGADLVQVFDTWAGELSAGEFALWSYPYLDSIIDRLKTDGYPCSLYIRNAYHLLDKMASLKADVVSLDWKTPLDYAADRLRPSALQGNLNPAVMLGPGAEVARQAETIMVSMKNYAGYIFNLGHGILPETPVDNVTKLVRTVHEFKR